jgi:lysophospholipase L1-like esterase
MSHTELRWSAAWTASPQRPGAGFDPNWSAEGFEGHTLRQTVRLSIGGDALRIRLSNLVILAGINDIAISEMAETSPFPVLAPYAPVSAEEVIAGHLDMIRQARAAGLRTAGATLLPIRDSAFSTPHSETKRARINAWIRESKQYDAVIDLAQAMGDSLDPAHDSGDHLHLSDAGYRAMAEAVDLTLL